MSEDNADIRDYEREIKKLTDQISTFKAIAAMKNPSISSILRRYGYNYEADTVDHLISRFEQCATS